MPAKTARRTTSTPRLADLPTIPFTPREPAMSVPILVCGERHRLIGPTLQPPPPGAFAAPAVSPPGHFYHIVPMPSAAEPALTPTWPRLASIG